jgi:methanogenic corrinoid protein MtbC1
MTPPTSHAPSLEESYPQYLDSLLAGDSQRCRVIFQECLDADIPIREVYLNLVQRPLYEVGELWERHEVSVATEHLATAITESLLNLAGPRLFAGPRSGKSAMVACAPNELHQIGAKIVADHFELNGWRSFFLGANTPSPDLQSLIAEKRPDAVALSATMSFKAHALISEAIEIRAAFPKLPVLVGGQAFHHDAQDGVEGLRGVRLIRSLEELEDWIRDDRPIF